MTQIGDLWRSFAVATAGKMCPPLAPATIKTFILLLYSILTFSYRLLAFSYWIVLKEVFLEPSRG
jgi:hypothetical protein